MSNNLTQTSQIEMADGLPKERLQLNNEANKANNEIIEANEADKANETIKASQSSQSIQPAQPCQPTEASKDEFDSLKIKQLIALHKASLPPLKILKILGVTQDELEAMEDSPQFKEAEIKEAENDNLLDNTWDSVEKKALRNITIELASNPDPLFSLQVAKAANGAMRRSFKRAEMLHRPASLLAQSQANQFNLSQSSSTTIINLDKRTLELLQSDSMGRINSDSVEAAKVIADKMAAKVESTASYSDAIALLNPNSSSLKAVNSLDNSQADWDSIVASLPTEPLGVLEAVSLNGDENGNN